MTFLRAAQNLPITILSGQAARSDGRWGAPANNITLLVPYDTLRVEETGNYEPGVAEFDVIQQPIGGVSMPSNAPYFEDMVFEEGTIRIEDDGETLFRGNVRALAPEAEGITRVLRVRAIDVGSILDKTIIAYPDRRPAGESDRDRILHLFNTYAYAMPNVDLSGVQTLDASLPKQTLQNVTLRQAIERVLGLASKTANYWVDANGRVRTWDVNNPDLDSNGVERVAPYEVNITPNPAADEIAPEDFVFELDTENIINWVKVRGTNASARLVVTDDTSIALYGRRQAFIDAPDANTENKALRVGNAVLADAAYAQPRGSFSVQGLKTTKWGERWRPAQTLRITSPFHGLTRKRYRINRVITTYVSGAGDRKMEIEFGGRRKWLSGGYER